MEKPTDTANTATAQALTTPSDSTFRFWGDDYEMIADLGEGYALIAHPNGPAICDGNRISTIDPYREHDDDDLLDVKRKAIKAYREWSWPKLKDRLTFPVFDR
jgi:hypothetical protein